MGKLKALRPSLGVLAPRLGYQPGDERGRNRARRVELPWRGWYKTARWKRLQRQCFERDGWVCQRTGELLGFKAPHPRSPVAHHRRAHRGDPALFWDINNIETVSKAWHDRHGQREDLQA